MVPVVQPCPHAVGVAAGVRSWRAEIALAETAAASMIVSIIFLAIIPPFSIQLPAGYWGRTFRLADARGAFENETGTGLVTMARFSFPG